MTAMDPALDAALAGFNPTIFGAVEIALPNHMLRLLDTSCVITFDGKTFAGTDATYGSINAIGEFRDGRGDEAPNVQLRLAPASDAASADISSPADQGSKTSIWLGVVDPQSGQVIGEPLLFYLGLLDTTMLRSVNNSRLLDLEITSAFELCFFNDDGVRLSDTFHRSVHPGETGLSQVTGIEHQNYWGTSPQSGVTR